MRGGRCAGGARSGRSARCAAPLPYPAEPRPYAETLAQTARRVGGLFPFQHAEDIAMASAKGRWSNRVTGARAAGPRARTRRPDTPWRVSTSQVSLGQVEERSSEAPEGTHDPNGVGARGPNPDVQVTGRARHAVRGAIAYAPTIRNSAPSSDNADSISA